MNEHLECGGLGREKFPVLETRKFGIPNRVTVVTGEQISQAFINAFVDEQFHQIRVSTSSLASCKTFIATSRLTVGNPMRKSSNVSPPSMQSNKV